MSNQGNLPLTAEDITEIISILDTAPYDELELETEHFKLIVKRGVDGGWVQETQTLTKPEAINNTEYVEESPAQAELSLSQGSTTTDDGLLKVTSPIVGTFYRAPKPGADPFIEVGSQVKPDTIIAIIEVMKLMNSIPAGLSGEIVEILAEDACFVEKGQLLMRVRPADLCP